MPRLSYDMYCDPPHFEACLSHNGGPCDCDEIDAKLRDREAESRVDRERDGD